MMTPVSIIFLASLLPTVFSSYHGTPVYPREASAPISKFGYTGVTGPLNWHALDLAANAKCAHGKHQSPININSTIPSSDGSTLELEIPDYPNGAPFENLGSTVEVIVSGDLTKDGKQYKLAQFHFHTPSEHRINEESFPMEVHFVFKATDASITVIGLVIEVCTHCDSDTFLKGVFSTIDNIQKPGSTTTTESLNFQSLITHLKTSKVYKYPGSLTTPPCSEGVAWTVSAKPLHIHVELYEKVKKVIKFNSRYTQNYPGEQNLLELAAKTLNPISSPMAD